MTLSPLTQPCAHNSFWLELNCGCGPLLTPHLNPSDFFFSPTDEAATEMEAFW